MIILTFKIFWQVVSEKAKQFIQTLMSNSRGVNPENVDVHYTTSFFFIILPSDWLIDIKYLLGHLRKVGRNPSVPITTRTYDLRIISSDALPLNQLTVSISLSFRIHAQNAQSCIESRPEATLFWKNGWWYNRVRFLPFLSTSTRFFDTSRWFQNTVARQICPRYLNKTFGDVYQNSALI